MVLHYSMAAIQIGASYYRNHKIITMIILTFPLKGVTYLMHTFVIFNFFFNFILLFNLPCYDPDIMVLGF